jgi:D-xylose transport system substrate-binding protein
MAAGITASGSRTRWTAFAGVLVSVAVLTTGCGDDTEDDDAAAASLQAEDGATASTLETTQEGDTGTTEGDETDGDIVIGVAMKTQLQKRWEFDVQAMQEKAEELGVELVVQWANDDPQAQASQVENLLSQDIDALIITPVDGVAAAEQAEAAKAAGIPVVSYDIGIQNTTDVDYFVIRDNPMVGVLQAEAALEFAPSGKYALIEGDAANDVAQAIAASHEEVLSGADVEIVYNDFTKNWDPQTALATAENLLSANNDEIAAFLTANDGMATGVIQALEARALAGQVFVSGLDADVANLQLIKSGAQTMSVWTKIDEQGALAVDIAAQLIEGEAPEPEMTVDNGAGEIPAALAPVVPVTADTLCEFVTEVAPEGWVTVEDVYDDPSECS